MTTSLIGRSRARRLLTRAGMFGAVVTAVVTVAAGTAFAASGTVHTSSGEAVNVRSGPHTSSSVVGSIASGTSISFNCQTYGDTVTGLYGTGDIWDHVSNGYVSDTYVYTGADGLVAPLCSGSASVCSTSGLGDPNSCTTAVAWAKSHETTTYHDEYYRACDHVVALAYGFSFSGSETAYIHWTQIPSGYKHAGDTNVPAGGLAFFSGGDGHVMISIGGGNFVSNDIGGNGTLTVTTIAKIKSQWGKPYLGWAQPWFKANH